MYRIIVVDSIDGLKQLLLRAPRIQRHAPYGNACRLTALRGPTFVCDVVVPYAHPQQGKSGDHTSLHERRYPWPQ